MSKIQDILKKTVEINNLVKRSLSKIEDTKSWEQLKVKFTGKKSEFTFLLKSLSSFDKDERAEYGKVLNKTKSEIEKSFYIKKLEIQKKELNSKLQKERIDIHLPERPYEKGTVHPISRTLDEITNILGTLSFDVEEGPHIENDYNNFTALNISEDHPARQDHDTFYIKGKDNNNKSKLLRTHTSPVQIRVMKKGKLPVRIIAPGATYRCDDDATHSPMFHQVEGLVIDENINMAQLKGVMQQLLTNFFNIENSSIRFRPSYFPFTEPSAEVDIKCMKLDNELKIGEGEDWLEVLGCGMVNPIVLKNCNIDTRKYSGFAFGLGVERFAMLKYGIPDLRMFYESDIKWLKHYGFNPRGFPNILRKL